MSERAIDVVHVGSASRDLSDDDPRGWRLGGGVTYAAMATARLGLRTAALVGADAAAAGSDELELLRQAGVSVRVLPLDESPVFRNVETRDARIQTCLAPGRPLPLIDLPAEWQAAAAWALVPVAGEIGDAWAGLIPEGVVLAVGWQGWLRGLAAGRRVVRRPPAPSALLQRADLVGVSRHDLVSGMEPSKLRAMLRPSASLLVTDGARGGELWAPADGGPLRAWRYEAIAPVAEVDPTGAGDVFLATLLACRVRPAIVPDGGPGLAGTLALAAAAASLAIERPGVLGVADLAAVIARMPRDGPGGAPAPLDRP